MIAQRIDNSERLEVNRLIDALLDGRLPPIAPSLAWPVEAIRASQALPINESWTGFSGINRDGELVFVDLEPTLSISMLVKPILQRIALFEASKRFPTLRSLLPQRPEHARTCSDCNGTGRIDFGILDVPKLDAQEIRKITDRIVCSCGGLGWFPKDE